MVAAQLFVASGEGPAAARPGSERPLRRWMQAEVR